MEPTARLRRSASGLMRRSEVGLMGAVWGSVVLMVVVVLFLGSGVPKAEAQMGDPFGDYTPEGVAAVKSDIPFIQCDVCNKVAEQLLSRLEYKKKHAKKNKPVGEYDIIELTEKICDRKTIDGGWVLRTDMEEDGDRIKLVEYDFDGECGNECRTIQKACENVIGDRDTDISELLQSETDISVPQLQQKLCHEMSDACVNPPPPVPKSRKPGEKFEKPKPKDYSKIAEEMGVKPSVMHNAANVQIPEGLPVMPPPKHLTDPPKDKKKKKKKKSRSSDFESMSEL